MVYWGNLRIMEKKRETTVIVNLQNPSSEGMMQIWRVL